MGDGRWWAKKERKDSEYIKGGSGLLANDDDAVGEGAMAVQFIHAHLAERAPAMSKG